MSELKFSVRASGRLFAELRDAGSGMGKAMTLAVRRILVAAGDNVGKEIRTGGSLNRRSGRLAASWTAGEAEVNVTESGGEVKGSIASKLAYAGIHETGGTVRPKSSRYLAIPLPAARTEAGVSRYASPRQIPDLFALRSKAGNVILARSLGHGQIEPMYVLKDSVTIPPSRYVTRAIDKTGADAQSIADAAIGEVVAQIRGDE